MNQQGLLQRPAPPADEAMAEQPMPAEEMGAEQEGQDNPAFVQGMKFAVTALYQQGAADSLVKIIRQTENPAEAMANTAYEMAVVVDEKTEGQIPDDLIPSLGLAVLSEVAEIAEAAGVQITAGDVGMAMKTMILRYLGEAGVDTTQLQQQMDQVTPEQLNELAAQAGVSAGAPAAAMGAQNG